jgi:hypothetical protein
VRVMTMIGCNLVEVWSLCQVILWFCVDFF